ncbi:MAG: ABC transporter permease [Acidobacteria bacterium]|nr:MAG: ABC transporter permease [Acidobacteriota bacterium]
MSDLFQDIRYGLRMMAKAPVVMAVAAISLAVGIAANTVTFSVVNGFFFNPFPYAEQDRLVVVYENHQKNLNDEGASPGNYLDWRERSTVFEELIAYEIVRANLTGGDEPERVRLVNTSPETFGMMGRQPFIGRDFDSDEGSRGGVVILSFPFWQRYFGEEAGILGDEITVNGVPHTVIGVMPEDFDFIPANVDVYRPTDWTEGLRRDDRDDRSLLVMGRLVDGRGIEEAQAELEAIASQLETEYPDANAGYGVHAIPLRELFPGPTDTMLMYILMTVAGFVLLIACANIANLLLARAEGRQREIAVRTAMGAGRARILRQLLTESVLLAVVGGTLGTLLSIYGVRGVASGMPAELPRSFMPVLDATVLMYTLAISMLAGVVFGIAPALHSFAGDLRESLGEARGGTVSRQRNRLRSAFVVIEIAAALALLVGGGVLLGIFTELVNRSPGFESKGVLTAQLTVSEDRYPSDADVLRFYEEAIRRLEEVSGIETVAAMIDLPRSRGVSHTEFTFDGREQPLANEEPTADWQAVNPQYFSALGVPLSRGRALSDTDRTDTQLVTVVNERFVEVFLPDEEPLGTQITVLGASRQIVGVSKNVFQTRMPLEGGKIGPALYLPMAQKPVRNMSLAMRASGEPTALADAVRAAIWAVDPAQPVTAIQTLDEHIATQLSGPRIISFVLALFGAAALMLSAIGIYGVMAHSVAQRTREIGIRMALGAAGKDVVKLVTRQGMSLAAIGLCVGAPLAYAMVRAIQTMFLAADMIDPKLIVGVTLTLAAVAFTATFLPALRASRVQPTRALQTE